MYKQYEVIIYYQYIILLHQNVQHINYYCFKQQFGYFKCTVMLRINIGKIL